DCSGRDTALAHRIADLVESDHYIPCCIDPFGASPLASVDSNATVIVQPRSNHRRQLATNVGAKCGIDAVEREMTFGGVDGDAVVSNGHRLGGAVGRGGSSFAERAGGSGGDCQALVG